MKGKSALLGRAEKLALEAGRFPTENYQAQSVDKFEDEAERLKTEMLLAKLNEINKELQDRSARLSFPYRETMVFHNLK